MNRVCIHTFLLLVFLCLCPPSQLWAFMSGGAPVGPGMIVQGCCDKECAWTVGRIATPWGVNMAFGWFESTLIPSILQTGEAYTSGNRKVAAVIDKRFEAQNANLRKLVTSYGFAREKSRNNRIYGRLAAAYPGWERPDVQIGQEAGGAVDDRSRQRIENYMRSFRKKSRIAKRLKKVEASEINPGCVFPPDGTFSPEQGKKLLVSLETLVDAFPATEPPDGSRERDRWEEYRAIRDVERFRAKMAEAVLAQVMAGYLPTVPVSDGLREMWQDAGGKKDPLEIKGGRMSEVGYLGFLVRSRFANDQYRTGKKGIHAMTRSGLLRELASVKALRLAIEQRQLRRSQQIAFLAAMQVSGKAAAKSLELNKIFKKVMRE